MVLYLNYLYIKKRVSEVNNLWMRKKDRCKGKILFFYTKILQ